MDLGVDCECPWCHLYFWQWCWWLWQQGQMFVGFSGLWDKVRRSWPAKSFLQGFSRYFYCGYDQIHCKISMKCIISNCNKDFKESQRRLNLTCAQANEQRLQRDNTRFSFLVKSLLLKEAFLRIRHISCWSPRGMFSSNLLIKNIRVSLNNLFSPLVVWVESPVRKHALEC